MSHTDSWTWADSVDLTAQLAVLDARPIKLTQAERAAGVRLGADLIARGRMTRGELARRLNCTLRTVHAIANATGIDLPPDPPGRLDWAYAWNREHAGQRRRSGLG